MDEDSFSREALVDAATGVSAHELEQAPRKCDQVVGAGTAGNENPTGTATFGVFPGNARRIYQREVY